MEERGHGFREAGSNVSKRKLDDLDGVRQRVVNAGTLPLLVNHLKRHHNGQSYPAASGVIRKVVDAIANLDHKNDAMKTFVRVEGGIPPLVELLRVDDKELQGASAGALRTLAFRNDENKNLIVECNALPTLILMLMSEDSSLYCEAVALIVTLVHSSPNIKKKVILAGALQPIIRLLSSPCLETQRGAALLLGQFAYGDSNCKVHIVQRGAVRPLIELLESSDPQVLEVSAFVLGLLAQDTHNQAGIAHSNGMAAFLKLLDSENGSVQHKSACALYSLANNEDNVAEFVVIGGFQKLMDGEFISHRTKECVSMTLKRLVERMHGRVLDHLLFLMRVSDMGVKKRVALALAHLCSPAEHRTIFIDNNGLDLVLELLASMDPKQQHDGSAALYKLASKVISFAAADADPLSLTSRANLAEHFLNNPTLPDVTFLVEGMSFHAHRIVLCTASDSFRAMLEGNFKEKYAANISIPNIRWVVFEKMMRFIYTGSVNIDVDMARELLKAADQYLLEGLKHRCAYILKKVISEENVVRLYEISEAFNVKSLRTACIMFSLKEHGKLTFKSWYSGFIQRILITIRIHFIGVLIKPVLEIGGYFYHV